MSSGKELEQNEFRGHAEVNFDSTVFIIVSSILACVALLSHSVPVLIGAMIVAPAFDPLIAIPFGVLNKDWRLVRQGLVNSLILFAISFGVCLGTVWVIGATNAIPMRLIATGADMITERLTVGFHSVITALVAGAGGALAHAAGRQSVIVGVIVSLALVPALAATAISFVHRQEPGWGGLLLFAVNVGGIIVSGLFVLYLRFGVGKAKEKLEE